MALSLTLAKRRTETTQHACRHSTLLRIGALCCCLHSAVTEQDQNTNRIVSARNPRPLVSVVCVCIARDGCTSIFIRLAYIRQSYDITTTKSNRYYNAIGRFVGANFQFSPCRQSQQSPAKRSSRHKKINS